MLVVAVAITAAIACSKPLRERVTPSMRCSPCASSDIGHFERSISNGCMNHSYPPVSLWPRPHSVTSIHMAGCAILLIRNTFAMGSFLALAESMRTLGLLLTLLATSPQVATDQKPAVP